MIGEIIDLRLQVIQGEDEGVLEIIRALSAERKIACFSNTHALHWNHMLATYKSFELFHHTIASHLIQAVKPDPKAFDIVCRQLKAAPSECLLIDDLSANVEAARRVGWHSIHFKDSVALKEELQGDGISL